MSEQKIKGIVDKISRKNGKPDAQVILIVPAMVAANLPFGEVFITIKPVQESMFPNGKAKGTVIRGTTKGKKQADEDEDEDDE